MKKFNFLFSLPLILLLLLFTACPPISPCYLPAKIYISISPDYVRLESGESQYFVYTLIPDELAKSELGDFTVTDTNENIITTKSYSGIDPITDSIEFTVPDNDTVGTIITLTFTVTERTTGNQTTSTATIEVCSPLPDVATVTGKTVNYKSTDTNTQFGWYLTTNSVDVTFVDDTNADVVFLFNDTYRQQILSPDAQEIEIQDAYAFWDYDISNKKNTKFKKMTADDFENATPESLDAISIAPSVTHPGGGNGIDKVQEGDVYAFVLADGRKGMFKVSASNPPYSKSPAIQSSITLDFKFQQGTAGDAK